MDPNLLSGECNEYLPTCCKCDRTFAFGCNQKCYCVVCFKKFCPKQAKSLDNEEYDTADATFEVSDPAFERALFSQSNKETKSRVASSSDKKRPQFLDELQKSPEDERVFKNSPIQKKRSVSGKTDQLPERSVVIPGRKNSNKEQKD